MLITCNAKINIGLEILNKRTDDYHNINTIFHKICLGDELVIENSEKFEFIFNSNLQISKENNIAYKAALEFGKIYELDSLPVRITINKNIPAGAGLAGGSSDAASVFKGLTRFFGFDYNPERLADKAATLGSDVPFFLLYNTSAIGSERGNKLIPFDMHLPYYLLLLMPGIHISTAAAYKSLNRTGEKISGTDYLKMKDIITDNPREMRNIFKNDFEEPAFKQYPELANIKEQLYEAGAFFASMSGSGSSVYAFFFDAETVETAVEKFSRYKTYICRPDPL
jgi:4-diphosphocytidyl-2-C-methyl-D-erythritol kinase